MFAEIRGLAKEYYKATKGSRALVWSRGLRDMCGLGAELSDEELAAQEFITDDAYRLTIWQWHEHVARREYLIPLLFALSDGTHGNLRVLCDFLRAFNVPFTVDQRHGWSKPPKKRRC